MENGSFFLRLYYAATALFLLLDFVFNINVRVAFLEQWPGWRLFYYGLCFAIFAAIAWRPALAGLLGVAESLVTLVALILTMAVRVMVVPVDALETGYAAVTVEEIVNFLLSGGIAWFYWQRGMRALVSAEARRQSR